MRASPVTTLGHALLRTHAAAAEPRASAGWRIWMWGSILGLIVGGPAAPASEIGRKIAEQVKVSSYRYYLDEELYAHDGDNRHTVYGPEHDPCRANVRVILESLGLDVQLHEFDYYGPRYNIVATQWGMASPNSQYIVGAHFDSVGNPGADDNASGVAGVLELARVLSQYGTQHTIKYIAFDAEEQYLVGSTAYVNDHSTDDVRGMITMDLIAFDTGAYASDIYGREASHPLKVALATAISEYGNGLTPLILGPLDRSDHAPFEWAGFQACWLNEHSWSENPCYHQPCDSVDNPGYINYEFAADNVRSIAGYLADHAGVVLPEPCVGDLDGDGDTDHEDLGILLAAFGIDANGDLDGDGHTGQADLGILLADWACGT